LTSEVRILDSSSSIQTTRTTVVRSRERGRYERETINAILDEALICHVGFSVEGQPYVLPTTHARVGDNLYVHGSVASRMLKNMKAGFPVCVTVTLLDGLVLARSAFNHSMNYRSAVILGVAREVTNEQEKRAAFDALVNHVVPGRSADVRAADAQELKATSVLCLPITEASAKVRRGPPIDAEADYALKCWAGVLPMQLVPGHPVDDPRLEFGTPVPACIAAYRRDGAPSDID
jgi:nitroimidazol reductase NimA-like FMN-containing flavoprotein (pyridoxamine 5'-phosphate oxidase superfamily)